MAQCRHRLSFPQFMLQPCHDSFQTKRLIGGNAELGDMVGDHLQLGSLNLSGAISIDRVEDVRDFELRMQIWREKDN